MPKPSWYEDHGQAIAVRMVHKHRSAPHLADVDPELIAGIVTTTVADVLLIVDGDVPLEAFDAE